MADPQGWTEYYERVYLMRARELDYFATHVPSFIGPHGPIFLLGHSEGGMVAARYHHPDLEARLAGRIISAWSCEHNYFVGSSQGAQVCGGSCSRRSPVLNIIGSEDEFFSPRNFSVASRILASGASGASGRLEGHCHAALRRGGFQTSVVSVLGGAGHDHSLTHDNTARGLLSEFLADPAAFARGGSRALSLLCRRRAQGLFACREDGEGEGLSRTEAGMAHAEYHFPPRLPDAGGEGPAPRPGEPPARASAGPAAFAPGPSDLGSWWLACIALVCAYRCCGIVARRLWRRRLLQQCRLWLRSLWPASSSTRTGSPPLLPIPLPFSIYSYERSTS